MATPTLLSETTIQDEEASDAYPRKHEWTLEEVYRAMAAGVFSGEPCDRLNMELIEGELIRKMPQNRPHTKTISKTSRRLAAAFGDGFHTLEQSPLLISRKTAPEPDVMVVVGDPDDYDDHPTPADARVVVEIAHTSATIDRNRKAALYASAGVTDYWILVLASRTLEVRRDPAVLQEQPGIFQYQTLLVFGENEAVSPLYAPDAVIKVSDLFPRLDAE